MDLETLSPRIVGYKVCTQSGTPVGRIVGVRALGIRLHRIPQRPGRHGYLPAAAIAAIDHRAGVVITRLGIAARAVVDSPAPPDDRPGAWHTSAEWWSDLMGHYGLYDPTGHSRRPLLRVAGD